jgi:V8-like Glu-specific endopeptidase
MGAPKTPATVGLALALALTGCLGESDQSRSSAPDVQPIIGGEETNYESWQGVIGLFFPLGNGQRKDCTGTLIDPAVVLTAGHCVYFPEAGVDAVSDPNNLAIVGGPYMYNIQFSRARAVVLHPKWDGNIDDPDSVDLALIHVADPITEVEPYGIHIKSLHEGDTGKIAGYGYSDPEDAETKMTHRVGDTTVLEIEGGRFAELGDPASTCIGDSGGPFFIDHDGQWLVAAVTSFGDFENSCRPDMGGYSVALHPYLAWLDDTLFDMTGVGLDLDDDSSGNSCHFAPFRSSRGLIKWFL